MDAPSPHDRCTAVVQQLAPEDARVWMGLLRAHARLAGHLDGLLQREHDLGLRALQVLLDLEQAGGRSRMCTLSEHAGLSRAGATRLVDRLEERGLVRRERCPEDARGSHAVLTEDGSELLAQATATHAAAITAELDLRLTPLQKLRAGEILSRLAQPTTGVPQQ